ncbi:UDP-GalNAc:beta-1,3-N-acetylgalactosaminyltransferase 2 [Nilaparvata lugens]|uniref:UDP-GalNAc:beta-1, 3-N-acetylgalactosaminyltransferase 2 n=1 Tax=Nilaparvata lugens TaxID=108931 RepID=UPI00193DF09F|nr:UDP-GalNAc:beta-1,3-N-acetylgalactosaminyltransferase 2 [Nilaparvata lugens]
MSYYNQNFFLPSLITLVVCIVLKLIYDINNVPATQLVIGIISAQENFNQRKTLRDTWLTLASELDVKYYFVIGKGFCPIPLEYRSSYLSCEKWNPNLEGVFGETVLNTSRIKIEDKFSKPFKGFSFILSHGIIINRIGISSKVLNYCKLPVRVILENAISGQRVATSTFINDGRNTDEPQGVIWKNIPPIHSHEGFEGTIYVSSDSISTLGSLNLKTELHDRTKIVLFLQNIDNNGTTEYYEGSVNMVAFSYTISDYSALKRKLSEEETESNSWLAYTEQLWLKVLQEKNHYNDIVLVDVVDVYRNLPKKIIEFYKWINANVKFVYALKTDDDVFIDLPGVMRELSKANQWNWWSCFRIGWPVRRAGKWRETVLNRTEYPPFPSGAGYVVDSLVVHFLVDNYENLVMDAQGEDVSMGIWLDDLNLLRLEHSDECKWACSNRCVVGNCNIMELSTNQILLAWHNYNNCGLNICKC